MDEQTTNLQPVIRWFISDELLQRIYETEQVHSQTCWQKGDQTLEVIGLIDEIHRHYLNRFSWAINLIAEAKHHFGVELVEQFLTLGRMDIYRWFSKECGGSRWSARQIRRFVKACEFYPQETRNRFYPLPFSHFDYAKGFGEQAVEILEISLRIADRNGGRPCSVDQLEFYVGDLGYTADILDDEEIMVDDSLRQMLEKQRYLTNRFQRIQRFMGEQVDNLFDDDGKRAEAKVLLSKLFTLLMETLEPVTTQDS